MPQESWHGAFLRSQDVFVNTCVVVVDDLPAGLPDVEGRGNDRGEGTRDSASDEAVDKCGGGVVAIAGTGARIGA